MMFICNNVLIINLAFLIAKCLPSSGISVINEFPGINCIVSYMDSLFKFD